MLVLDGSGSMWGQIDGTAKITIAQEVVTEMVNGLPSEQHLGLIAYGHRRNGDCRDIEVLATPGTSSRNAILDAVRSVSPKGKTPMTDAVIQAAETLAYKEGAATVILISDGIETCAPDPCAAARALEQEGVQFTAHVIGFDVKDTDALTQMQCLARETGGRFLTAQNAGELADALDTVAAAPVVEPQEEPLPVEDLPSMQITGPDEAPAGSVQTYTFTGETGPSDFLAVYDSADVQVVYRTVRELSSMKVQLPTAPGRYEMRYEFEGRKNQVLAQLSLTLTDAAPALSVSGALVAGGTISVTWSGPGTEFDFLSIADPGGGGGYHTASDYLTSANPISLALPSQPGTYELRYIYGDQREILVKQPIQVD